MTGSGSDTKVILIRGGRVYRHDGDIHRPEVADILIADGRIAAIRADIAADMKAGKVVPGLGARGVDAVIAAEERLVIPGFVNAHYHSHDVLLKGCFETIPLEFWILNALPPSYPKRSAAEIRARTLLGAIECLRSGITTVQDLATIYPFDEKHLDTVLQAYADVGIRCVFALQIADVSAVDSVPFWNQVVPPERREILSGAVEKFESVDLPVLARDIVRSRRHQHPRITWALGPSSPETCSEALLSSLAELSSDEALPVYTHVYESKATALIARQAHARDGGSMIKYLARAGLLTPRLTMAHSVWMSPTEIDAIGDAGANVVLNPVGNLKTRSGVAPIRSYLGREVNVGLGCDNCSCGDAQNMFQAMKLFAGLAAVSNPEPGPPTAADAIWAATVGGARTAGLEREIGALRPGMAADLAILDLTDPSFVPLNSAARQLVFTEGGRGVETVIVDGRVVVRDRRITTIDERALREEIADLMPALRNDMSAVLARNEGVMPYLLEAHRRTWASDIGLNRYVAGGTDG